MKRAKGKNFPENKSKGGYYPPIKYLLGGGGGPSKMVEEGLSPERLRWFRKIRRFHLICTPISLTAQRNGGTRQRNAFQPLQFAPANAVPFIRGLKRSTGRTAVPIPDRHRSGRRRFSFSICRPIIFGWIWRDGIDTLPSALRTPPLKGRSFARWKAEEESRITKFFLKFKNYSLINSYQNGII